MLAPWKESYDKPRQCIKNRKHHFAYKVHLVKATVFPVVMYRCEFWTINKAEHQRIDAFEWWCWRRFLRVPWTARRPNQLILKEVNPECSLEWMILKLNLQLLLWPPDVKSQLTGKGADAGKDWRREEKGMTEDEMAEWHHWLKGHEFERTLGDHEEQERLACCSPRPWSGREPYTT